MSETVFIQNQYFLHVWHFPLGQTVSVSMSLSPLSEENTCSCSLALQVLWLQDFLKSIEHPRNVRPLIIVGGKWPQNVTCGVWSHVLGEGSGDRM